jgi:NAD(P)-dependent dehydrogenase (short-subunit alcohol dehydrogenase family)
MMLLLFAIEISKEAKMKRVALVTGGTRGLGAMSTALQDKGVVVAAVYHGNETAAESFKEETGIGVFKWDVADFESCGKGIARVEAELGPVDILVNNAGITRDVMLHRMTAADWDAVLRTNLGSMFNMWKRTDPRRGVPAAKGNQRWQGRVGEQSYEPIVPMKVGNRRASERSGHGTHRRDGASR